MIVVMQMIVIVSPMVMGVVMGVTAMAGTGIFFCG